MRLQCYKDAVASFYCDTDNDQLIEKNFSTTPAATQIYTNSNYSVSEGENEMTYVAKHWLQ